MKKLFLCVAAALALAACDKDTYRHEITLEHPSYGYLAETYADHIADSIVFYTFDSYMASCTQPWFTLDPVLKQAKLENGYYNVYRVSIPVTMEPNMTGKTRIAGVNIRNYGNDWDQTVGTGFLQVGWLNVVRPVAKITKENNLAVSAAFEMADSTQTLDSIAFHVESAWSLTSDRDFVKVQTEQGNGGAHIVRFSLEPNTTGCERTATLQLQSRGVTTPIKIVQMQNKK